MWWIIGSVVGAAVGLVVAPQVIAAVTVVTLSKAVVVAAGAVVGAAAGHGAKKLAEAIQETRAAAKDAALAAQEAKEAAEAAAGEVKTLQNNLAKSTQASTSKNATPASSSQNDIAARDKEIARLKTAVEQKKERIAELKKQQVITLQQWEAHTDRQEEIKHAVITQLPAKITEAKTALNAQHTATKAAVDATKAAVDVTNEKITQAEINLAAKHATTKAAVDATKQAADNLDTKIDKVGQRVKKNVNLTKPINENLEKIGTQQQETQKAVDRSTESTSKQITKMERTLGEKIAQVGSHVEKNVTQLDDLQLDNSTAHAFTQTGILELNEQAKKAHAFTHTGILELNEQAKKAQDQNRRQLAKVASNSSANGTSRFFPAAARTATANSTQPSAHAVENPNPSRTALGNK